MKNRLKELRHDHRMNAKEFARFLGVNYSHYVRWEGQQVQPSCESARKIAKKLGIRLDDLFWG